MKLTAKQELFGERLGSVCRDEILSMIPSGKPYVYALHDPIAEEVFYVGKGRNKRLLAHEREAHGPSGSPKCERIRSIWAAGLDVGYQILSCHETDEQALLEEGRQIKARGGLTNGMLGRNDPAAMARYLARTLKPWNVWLAEKERPAHIVALAREIHQEVLQQYFNYVFRPASVAKFLGVREFVSTETVPGRRIGKVVKWKPSASPIGLRQGPRSRAGKPQQSAQ